MEKEFPELSEEGRQPFSVKLSLESKNIYQPSLPFLCNVMTGEVKCFRYQTCERSC